MATRKFVYGIFGLILLFSWTGKVFAVEVNSEASIRFEDSYIPYEIQIKKVVTETAPANESLPVEMFLEKKELTNKGNTSRNSKSKIKIDLFLEEEVVWSQDFAIEDLPDVVKMNIPKDKNQTKNAKLPLKIRVSDSEGWVTLPVAEITTYAQSASEEQLNFSYLDEDSNITHYDPSKVNITGKQRNVVRTERLADSEAVKEYCEEIGVYFTRSSEHRTGYGIPSKVVITYMNEASGVHDLDFDLDNFQFNTKLKAPQGLLDKSLNYEQVGSSQFIEMEETQKRILDNGKSPQEKALEWTFELPHVNVEELTGKLYLDDELLSKKDQLQYEIKNGNRKFYTDIWTPLPDYQENQISFLVSKMGVNNLELSLTDQLDLTGYMYSHMGSETAGKDSILLEPVNLNDPFSGKIPENMTDSDIKWIKGE